MMYQKGFSAIEGLLVVVIVGLLCFTGWFVWHSQQNTNKTNGQAVSDSNPPTSIGHKAVLPQSPPPTVKKYLLIKEFGVNLPLTSADADAYYTVSGYDKSGKIPTQVDLSLVSLKNTQCMAGGSPPSIMIRYNETDKDPVSGELYTKIYGSSNYVGSWYYAVENSSGVKSGEGCQSTAVNQAKAAAAAAAFKKESVHLIDGNPQ